MQRLRIRFRRGEELKFISHLDNMRLWQRALRRANISLAYSEGFSPHPRISLAAPLAVGVTSDAELMDIVITNWITPHVFTETVNRQLPKGIEVMQVYPLAVAMPSLQSQIRFAEYLVEVATDKPKTFVEYAIASLMAQEHLPWEHIRDTGPHRYDLRILIGRIWVAHAGERRYPLGMNLKCDNAGSGRPEQVAAALGFGEPVGVHRTRLILQAS